MPLPPLVLFIVMLPKTHLTSGYPALDEWPHHHSYPGHEDLSCVVLLCIPATSSYLFCFCQLLPTIMSVLAWNVPLISPIFLNRCLVFAILFFSSISYIIHLRRLSYLSMLFSTERTGWALPRQKRRDHIFLIPEVRRPPWLHMQRKAS